MGLIIMFSLVSTYICDYQKSNWMTVNYGIVSFVCAFDSSYNTALAKSIKHSYITNETYLLNNIPRGISNP